MPVNSLGGYTAAHKSWDHAGNVIAPVEYSEGIRPHGNFMPAVWLPVKFYDKFMENWIVTMPGKGVALDNQGRMVPAQYGLAVPADIVYTQDDVDAGVIDVRTGAPLLLAAIGTFSVASVTDMMLSGAALTVGSFIGIASMPFLQWAGDGSALDDGSNPVAYRLHNYNMQHRATVTTDYVVEVPLVPATAVAEVLAQAGFLGTLVTYSVGSVPVATNTMRTPIVFANNSSLDAATRFAVQKNSVAQVKATGDWHINLTTGLITAYAAVDPVGGITPYSVTYSNYAAAPVAMSAFTSAVGNLKGGDFVVFDANSNFAPEAGTESFREVCGQVLETEVVLGKSALGKVRTAYNSIQTNAAGGLPGYAGQLDQMPGSATGGAPGKVHYAGAADRVVRINLINR